MPTVVPKSRDSGIPPWDAVLTAFRIGGDQKFAELQRRGRDRAGYVIGGWDESGTLKWWYSDIAHGGPWITFDDDTVAQEPRVYKTLRGAHTQVQNLREKHWRMPPVAHIGLVFWIHPDAYDQPLEKYQTMAEAGQFPGCPRQ